MKAGTRDWKGKTNVREYILKNSAYMVFSQSRISGSLKSHAAFMHG